MKCFNFIIALCLFPVTQLLAQDGSYDTSFGNNGITITDFEGEADIARQMALQPDGSIWVYGHKSFNIGFEKIIVRYAPNGLLDTNFGNNGIVLVTEQDDLNYTQLLPLGDGTVLAAGIQENNSQNDFIITKYTVTGSIDTSFGSNGTITLNVDNEEEIFVHLTNNNTITLLGATESNNEFVLVMARYLSDGTLDTTFGTGGIATTVLETNPSLTYNIYETLSYNSGFLISYSSLAQNQNRIVKFAKMNGNGTLDTSFGNAGIANPGIAHDAYTQVALTVLPNDSFMALIHISRYFTTGQSETYFSRYLSNGNLDLSYANNGIRDVGYFEFAPYKIIRQANSRLLAYGGSSGIDGPTVTIIRFYENGFMDNSFSGNGVFSQDMVPVGMRLAPDGAILGVSSTPWYSGFEDFAVYRLNNNPLRVEENYKSNVGVFPNPTSDFIMVSCTECSLRNIPYQITDAFGRVVIRGKIAETPIISLEGLATGIYYLATAETTVKLIKK